MKKMTFYSLAKRNNDFKLIKRKGYTFKFEGLDFGVYRKDFKSVDVILLSHGLSVTNKLYHPATFKEAENNICKIIVYIKQAIMRTDSIKLKEKYQLLLKEKYHV